jgi:hypothetical protein
LIPAGTPIAQVIPVKRDSWKMDITEDVDESNNISKFLSSQYFDRYKRLFWEKKEYK